jgi:hypothetical protein
MGYVIRLIVPDNDNTNLAVHPAGAWDFPRFVTMARRSIFCPVDTVVMDDDTVPADRSGRSEVLVRGCWICA